MNPLYKTSALIFLGLFSLLSPHLHAQWVQTGADIDGESNGDLSGYAVSLSADGTVLAIGATGNPGDANRGHVQVFKKIGGEWIQQGADINGEAIDDFSGYSISLSSDGNTVAIGAPGNSGGGNNRGHVRVYKNIGGAWTQQGADIDGEADIDLSGTSVSLSADGSTVAIGAYLNDGGGSDRGHVRVYKNIGGTWTQQGTDIDGEADNDQSGYSVSISADGSSIAIGAYENDGIGNERGHVRVYKNIGGTWTQQGPDIDGEADYDYSGRSVSISADGITVAIGAVFNDGTGTGNQGHVRVYKITGGTWIQQGGDIDGETDGDVSGYSVSLSADGAKVAIGAINNAGGGTNRGHIRIYKLTGGSWIQQGGDIDGKANGDASGYSVSLSPEGNTVAIGSPYSQGGGITRGQVRVFATCSQTQQLINAILALAKQKGKKIYVCHKGKTQQVSPTDFYFYLFLGGKLGKCEANYCEGLEIRGDDLDDFIGTDDDKTQRDMVLFPNPAAQIINVKLPFHTDQAVQIQVYNSLGQSMINQPFYLRGKDNGSLPVNIQKLPQGMYFLKVSGEGYDTSRPFTKL